MLNNPRQRTDPQTRREESHVIWESERTVIWLGEGRTKDLPRAASLETKTLTVLLPEALGVYGEQGHAS